MIPRAISDLLFELKLPTAEPFGASSILLELSRMTNVLALADDDNTSGTVETAAGA